MKSVKGNVMKWLSILCLLIVLAGGALPFATLTGNYKEMLVGFTNMFEGASEEHFETMEQMLGEFGYDIDLNASVDALTVLAEPLNDGEVSIMDFYAIYQNANVVVEELSGLTTPSDGLESKELGVEGLEEAENEQLAAVKDFISAFEQLASMASLISVVALVPVGLFGLLAVAVIIRIVLRLFNRRGLGVLISIFTILNAALMIALTYGVNFISSAELPIAAEYTMIPIVMVVCSILSCILWSFGRKQVKTVVVKKDVPVSETVPSVEEVVVNEEIPVEEIVETVEEAAVEVETGKEE